MSLGSPMPSETMHRALRYAKGRSMVVVAAAGNSGGSVGYPGLPETIAVSAADYNDKLADFSSRGAEVDFIAPGVDVVSTWPNNNTVSLSGTSMAAPHVAGLAALAVAQARARSGRAGRRDVGAQEVGENHRPDRHRGRGGHARRGPLIEQ